ncbi:3,4-dihydroxy-2-butanone-4-phosphate synthase [Myxococcota bacterium]|nr:3,4-dihydroxy-2-butanone-4-phosphate synthase [Myxococcota bacterium]MBU1429617.1 3,4-dihydroxy-2-butanone-4-phosphate synthase [Myxococcota bacterium]MBU1897423.1 3,4-dihydroxy-2-butanone-4-phosphate synthase [Myxococcota bacterium]
MITPRVSDPRDAETIRRVEAAIEVIRQGGMIILVDDEDRENEGDLVMAAAKVTPASINFMARHGRGLICLSLTPARCDQLNLPLMVSDNTSVFGTAFTISVEAATGVTTGISAADRAHTIAVAVAPDARPQDLSRPGHVFPLRAKAGGVLVRTGQTEGSVDLARLAGLEPAGVICEIMNEDGTMSRRPQLEDFARQHDLLMISVADLITYRLIHERLVERVAEHTVEIAEIGVFKVVSYRTVVDDLEHVAFIKGEPSPEQPVLGRVHPESVLGDLFRSGLSDTRWRLEFALRRMEAEGLGVLVYLQKPAPRVSRELQAMGARTAAALPTRDPLPTDLREFGIGAQILLDQGVRRLRLMTCTPARIKGIEGYGLEVVEHIPIPLRGDPPHRNAEESP